MSKYSELIGKRNTIVDGSITAHIKNAFYTLLRERGMIQQKVADELGFDKNYISRIARGLQEPPDPTKILIAKFFGCDSRVIWP